jgi:hypothetical protein
MAARMSARVAAIGFAAGVSAILHAAVIGWRGTGDERAPALPMDLAPAMTTRWVQNPDTKPLAAPDPMPRMAHAAAPAQTSAFGRFYPREMLDRPALPRSAFDSDMLEGLALSGLPIRARLYIDETGRVVDAVVSISSEPETRTLDAVRSMFLATNYIAARHKGKEVASYQDVQLEFSSSP